jgi:hypothetical protein
MAGSAGLIEDALAMGNSNRYGLLPDCCLRDRDGEEEKYQECEWCSE